MHGLITRRRFAGSVVATTVGIASSAPAERPQRELLPAKPEDLSEANWNEVQARYRNALRVYGARLSAEQRRMLLHILTTNQHMLASIRTFAVQNGDASACTLRLVTGDGTSIQP